MMDIKSAREIMQTSVLHKPYVVAKAKGFISGRIGENQMIWKIFHRLWFWFSQYLEEHPEAIGDWECQCQTCLSYAD